MLDSRRRWLTVFAGSLTLLAVKPLTCSSQGQSKPLPHPVPYPNGRDPNTDQGIDEPSRPNPKAVQEANQKKLRADVAKLYEMASDLKNEMDKTDSSVVVSVSLMKKAEQIEKLAKQIKGLAKG